MAGAVPERAEATGTDEALEGPDDARRARTRGAPDTPTQLPGPPVQLLAPDGRERSHSSLPHGLGDAGLRAAHRWMVLTRRIDAEAIRLQRQGQLSVYPSCLGQEAAQVGAAMALADQDWLFPTYRELAAALVRGVDPVEVLHLFRGTWLSGHDPRERRVAPLTIPIATQALHATGFAMGAQLDRADVVTLCCLGDGATSEGDAHEALTFAGVRRAPVVFLVQNNGWAISVPVAEQSAAPSLAHKAVGYGIHGVRVDGNDVLACHAVTREAVERARGGGGSTLIEALTYRREGHTTADDPGRYRDEAEVRAAERRDPVDRLERLLRRRGLLDDAGAAGLADEAESLAARVRDEIYDAGHGDPEEVFDHVLAVGDDHLERQRAQLREAVRRRGGWSS